MNHIRYLLPIKRQALDQEPLSNYQAPSTAWNDWEMGITTTLQRKQTDGCSYPYKGGNSSILKATFLNSYSPLQKSLGFCMTRNYNRILTSSVGHVCAHHYIVNNCLGRCSQHGITLVHIPTTTPTTLLPRPLPCLLSLAAPCFLYCKQQNVWCGGPRTRLIMYSKHIW